MKCKGFSNIHNTKLVAGYSFLSSRFGWFWTPVCDTLLIGQAYVSVSLWLTPSHFHHIVSHHSANLVLFQTPSIITLWLISSQAHCLKSIVSVDIEVSQCLWSYHSPVLDLGFSLAPNGKSPRVGEDSTGFLWRSLADSTWSLWCLLLTMNAPFAYPTLLTVNKIKVEE